MGVPDLDTMLRDYLERQKRLEGREEMRFDAIHQALEELQRWRLVIDERLQHLNKDVERVEETGRHHLPPSMFAPRVPALPVLPGVRNSILRLLENGLVKGILKALGVATIFLAGWLIHHVSIVVK